MYKKTGRKFDLKDGKKVVLNQGLEDGNFVIVTKQFESGMLIKEGPIDAKTHKPTYVLYGVRVKYKDEENVSFTLFEKDHEAFSKVGGIGDKIKIELNKEVYVNPNTGMEGISEKLTFSLVEA